MSQIHCCDERCICPHHQTPFIYAPAADEHCCQDITCEYSHGFERMLTVSRFQAAAPTAMDQYGSLRRRRHEGRFTRPDYIMRQP